MQKILFSAMLTFFALSGLLWAEAIFGQENPPPIQWKAPEDCCGDRDCVKAKVRIRSWDKKSRGFVVEINNELILLDKYQVGYSNKESAYCFTATSNECWKKVGSAKIPLVEKSCAICAIEKRDFVFQNPEPGPPTRKILVRKISPEARGGMIQKLRVLPVTPHEQCVFCHMPQKTILKEWTEAWFGRELPEIFGGKPHP